MNLIIDIGNTVAKVAVFDKGELVQVQYESNTDLACLSVLCNNFPIQQAVMASVVPLSDLVKRQLDELSMSCLMLGSDTPLPITNLYETPETLGYDRIAAVVGANILAPDRNLLVIDAGTCITFEFLDDKGRYHGGNISPGVDLRLKAMHQFTGGLPLVDINGRIVPMGKDTETAMRAGVLKGVEYEIEGYIRHMQEEYPDLLVFLTGGNGIPFDAKLKSVIFADKFLVLKGLNRILDYNNGQI